MIGVPCGLHKLHSRKREMHGNAQCFHLYFNRRTKKTGNVREGWLTKWWAGKSSNIEVFIHKSACPSCSFNANFNAKAFEDFRGGCTGTNVENNQAFFVNKWFTCIFQHNFENHKSGNVLSRRGTTCFLQLKVLQLGCKTKFVTIRFFSFSTL